MMRTAGRGRTSVDLFNFSFLDVLACTIGLLIFIMTIIAITSSAPSNRKAEAKLAKIDRMLKRNQARLAQVENVENSYAHRLKQRAAQTMNLAGANNHLRHEIAELVRQSKEYEELTIQTTGKIAIARKHLAKAVSLNSPTKAAKLHQSIRLTQAQVATIQKQIAALVKLRTDYAAEYYIPVRSKTKRSELVFEVGKNRIWRIGHKDFHYKTLSLNSFEYTRRANAVPKTLAEFISAKRPPQCLANRRPTHLLLRFFVRPGGFSTYRSIETWARNKKYAVNWYPGNYNRTFEFTFGSPSRQ